MPTTKATPANLANVVERMKTEKIGVIIVDPFQNKKTAEAIARDTGATVVDVAQFPGGIKGTDGYVELIDHLVKSISDALAK